MLAKLIGKDFDAVSTEQSADFIREYCNLTGGTIKNILEQAQCPVGITLPLVSRGFDNIFFSLDLSGKKIKDRWVLQSENYRVICSIQIEIKNEAKLSGIKLESTAAADEGEIDFL